ncbi:1667_t:CDS:1, partial [Gigaspora margarita]
NLLSDVVWGLDCVLLIKREFSISRGVWKLILNLVLRMFSADGYA